MHMRLLAAAAALVMPAFGQATAGQSVATVTVSTATPQGEMYVIDHQANTATALSLSTALATERPNCVTMLNGAVGFVGTNPLSGTPNVYRITIAAGTVTEALLNTSAPAHTNVAQIAILGSDVWFTTAPAVAPGGVLQSVPIAGGPVTTRFDFASMATFTGLANAIAVIGTKVYVASFDSTSNTASTGSLVVHDSVANTTSLVMALPQGRWVSGTTTFNTGIVNMHEDPANPGKLMLQGVYGDYLLIDPATATVVRHDFAGFVGPTATTPNQVNSFAYDPRTKDWIVGSRDGHVERMVDGHSAEKIVPGVGSSATPTANSINGIAHIAATVGRDEAVGAGCPGNGGYTPTDVPRGLPVRGNASFAFAVYSGRGGDAGALLIGGTPLNIDLGVIGAPGCILRTDILVTFPVLLAGTGDGAGTATIPLPIPAGAPVGAAFFHQWVELQGTPTNAAGLVLSNARLLTIE